MVKLFKNEEFPMFVLGHRGEILPHKKDSHENSLRSIRNGIEFADGVECDICKTKDNRLIVIHEARCIYNDVEYCLADNLNEESALKIGNRKLTDINSDELKELRLKNGESIPFFDEVLDLFSHRSGKLINIEIKGANTVKLILEEVQKRIKSGLMTKEQFLISSFDHKAIHYIRQNDTLGLKLGLLFLREDQPLATHMYPWLSKEEANGEYLNFSSKNMLSQISQDTKPDVIVIPEPTLIDKNIDMIKKYFPKAKIATWIFSEIQNDETSHIDQKISQLKNEDLLEAVIIDDPKKTADRLRELVA